MGDKWEACPDISPYWRRQKSPKKAATRKRKREKKKGNPRLPDVFEYVERCFIYSSETCLWYTEIKQMKKQNN